MDANELRAMCELLKRNELIGVPRVVVEALLSRLDAEDAMETYKIDVEYDHSESHWKAVRYNEQIFEYDFAAVETKENDDA